MTARACKNSLRIDIGSQGKGRGCWIAFGYVLARRQSQVIALHDCDILSYSRDYLARLCYPIANRNLGYEFSKGYYSRVTDRLHGRVTRLFMTPLLRSLQRLAGPHPFLTFLDSFRYPLAGEIAMMCWRSAGSRMIERHTWHQPKNTRASPENPSIVGAVLPPSDS